MTPRDSTVAAEQAHEREADRRARHDAEIDAIAADLVPLSPHAARCLAFQIVAAVIAQVIGLLPDHHGYGQRVHVIVLLVKRLHDALDHEKALARLHADADRVHSLFYQASRTTGRWLDEERIPADLAQAIRRASSPDIGRMLPLLVHDARDMLAALRLPWAPCADAIQQALSFERIDLDALDGLWQAAAAEPKDDVVLQALHVASGAQAVHEMRQLPAQRMRAAVEQLAAAVQPAVGLDIAPSPAGCEHDDAREEHVR